MSILEIELTPELEQRLHDKAGRRGLSTRDYARSLVLEDLSQEADATEPWEARQFNVMDFHGAGREALQGLDVQKYVGDLRNEWDR